MKTSKFDLLKNGNVKNTVWANPTTKEIYPANKNRFGYNALSVIGDEFYQKYGKNLKTNQGKSDYTKFYYSAKSMESVGFRLVLRGTSPIFN
jgi:hypothetical protein